MHASIEWQVSDCKRAIVVMEDVRWQHNQWDVEIGLLDENFHSMAHSEGTAMSIKKEGRGVKV